MTDIKTATIKPGTDGRYEVIIGPVVRAGYALTWWAQGRAELRRVDGTVIDTVAVATDPPAGSADDIAQAFPPADELPLISSSNPDLWQQQEPEVVESVPATEGDNGPTVPTPAVPTKSSGRTKASTAPATATDDGTA